MEKKLYKIEYIEPLHIQNSNPGTAMGAFRESNNNQ
jgi:hypothetical protein